MGVFNFFKRPQHQKFDYRPRFYDPEKEEREARLAKYRNEDHTESVKNRISAGFKRRSASGYGGVDAKRSNMRLIAILIVLLFLTYYFIQKYLPQIIDLLE